MCIFKNSSLTNFFITVTGEYSILHLCIFRVLYAVDFSAVRSRIANVSKYFTVN